MNTVQDESGSGVKRPFAQHHAEAFIGFVFVGKKKNGHSQKVFNKAENDNMRFVLGKDPFAAERFTREF